MSTLKELRGVRLDKLAQLKKLGVDAYPAKSNRNTQNIEVVEKFDELQDKEVVVAGRILSIRTHGKLTFIDVKDDSAKVQLYIKEEELQNANYKNSELNFADLHLLDTGDFIEGKGTVTKTQSGEMSVELATLRLLTKSLRPMPDQWDGLKDKETRLRRRYLDTNINEDVYQRFIRRAKFWDAHREFFKSYGFLEMNIPVLEMIPGGADANPFVTHMDAIDQDFYLRISQELYLKRLIGGGYPRVFEIGPRFRNEGLSDEHLPEHMAMEFYWAYADWKEGMEVIKKLFDHILKTVYAGKMQFKIRGFDVDFSKGWEIIDFAKIMHEKFGIDIHKVTTEEIKALFDKKGLNPKEAVNVPRGVDYLWKTIRKDIAGPAFLINHPKYISPLAKAKADDPSITERFQPIIAGTELGNGWSEINDPQDQLARFREQQNMRDSGDAEAQWLDIDYVEMLEYGMPPTFGYGHSERVFWYLEDVPAREGVPFPQLKFEMDENTKDIYNVKNPEPKNEKKSVSNSGEYSIAPEVKAMFPGISFAYTIIKGVKIHKANEELEIEKKEIVEEKKNLTVEQITEMSAINSYRQMLKQTKVDFHSKRPSPEALMRRIVQGKDLYKINTAVDAYNIAVLKNGIGLGGFDFDKISEPVTLRFSQKGEKMHLLGDAEPTFTEEGELVYSDTEKLITLDLNYRDINETKITEETKDIILFADGGPGIDPEDVKKAVELGAFYIQKFNGGVVEEIKLIL
ncbi:MAG TPA: lysine--tRNA ligase [Candidatus Saccharimonadales bacterium]|nr:lysine--tRNA ligase [Candidatus Saccharimonadales bacterium]